MIVSSTMVNKMQNAETQAQLRYDAMSGPLWGDYTTPLLFCIVPGYPANSSEEAILLREVRRANRRELSYTICVVASVTV